MLNEFVFYALIGGAAVFGISYWLVKKDKGIAWLITALLAFLVVVFIFPGPQTVSNLSDMFNNLALLFQKALYLIGWFAGAFAISKITP